MGNREFADPPGVPVRANPSPWGTSDSAAARPAHATLRASKIEPIPQALTEILNRPDTDLVTLPNNQRRTVKEIRTEARERQAVAEALKTGKVPAGRKRVRVATARSPQHDDLLNASKSIRDIARRDAAAAWTGHAPVSEGHPGQGDPAAAWTAPSSISDARTGQGNPATAWSTPAVHAGQGDPAAAWAQPGAGSGMRSKQRQTEAAALTPPVAATELHSGIGNAAMSQSGPASLRLSKTSSTQLSQQPSQEAVAQASAAGIALVNLHSKGVQFTPGGLYTIIGSGFGNTVGGVDLVGPQLPGGRLALQVTQWGDRQLQAQLPEPMSGIADQAVTLRVTTRGGTLYTKDVQFYATRQPIVLGGAELDLSRTFDVNLGNQNDWSAPSPNDGYVIRSKSGNNIDCPSVGQDSLRTKLPPGWAMVEVAISTWLPSQGDPKKDFFGQDGDTVVSGGYSITQIPAGLTNQTYAVNWGVLRSHSTNGLTLIPKFTGNDFGWSGNDGCVSAYDIEVTLVGPAGLRPY